MLEGFNFA
jgi:hypothetical protein